MTENEQAAFHQEFLLMLAETHARLRSAREELRLARARNALDLRKELDERAKSDEQLLAYANEVEQLKKQLAKALQKREH